MIGSSTPEQLIRAAGVDEAGRGPLAGPVVAACVVLPIGFHDERIQDSKKVSAKLRSSLSSLIKHHAIGWSVIAVGSRRIETINIREATRLAMRLCMQRVLKMVPDVRTFLVDGDMTSGAVIGAANEVAIIGGDGLHEEIAAASIVAKEYRDQLMCLASRRYPNYGLEKHFGYGTVSHRNAIAELGPTPLHRYSFKGVREYCDI